MCLQACVSTSMSGVSEVSTIMSGVSEVKVGDCFLLINKAKAKEKTYT